MIIDEEIQVRINASNADYYQSKGYEIPQVLNKGILRFTKSSTFLKVRSLDIAAGSTVKIRRECVCCKEISSIQRSAYREMCSLCAKKQCKAKEACRKFSSNYNLCDCGERKLTASKYCAACKGKHKVGTGKGPPRCNSCGVQFKDYGKKNLCMDCFNKNRPKGEEHHNFNPNLTDEDRRKQGYSQAFRVWSLSVKKRDGFKCTICYYDKGKTLCSHHLDGWDKFPNKRFLIENGITLCRSCHLSFHEKCGYGNNTKEQFELWKADYLNNNKK